MDNTQPNYYQSYAYPPPPSHYSQPPFYSQAPPQAAQPVSTSPYGQPMHQQVPNEVEQKVVDSNPDLSLFVSTENGKKGVIASKFHDITSVSAICSGERVSPKLLDDGTYLFAIPASQLGQDVKMQIYDNGIEKKKFHFKSKPPYVYQKDGQLFVGNVYNKAHLSMKSDVPLKVEYVPVAGKENHFEILFNANNKTVNAELMTNQKGHSQLVENGKLRLVPRQKPAAAQPAAAQPVAAQPMSSNSGNVPPMYYAPPVYPAYATYPPPQMAAQESAPYSSHQTQPPMVGYAPMYHPPMGYAPVYQQQPMYNAMPQKK